MAGLNAPVDAHLIARDLSVPERLEEARHRKTGEVSTLWRPSDPHRRLFPRVVRTKIAHTALTQPVLTCMTRNHFSTAWRNHGILSHRTHTWG